MSLKSLTVESEIALGFFADSLSTAHSGPGLNFGPLLGARLGHCVITHLLVFRKYLNLKLCTQKLHTLYMTSAKLNRNFK